MFKLESLPFNNSFSQLPDEFFQHVQPTPLGDLKMISFNEQGAKLIKLAPREEKRPEFIQYLSGQKDHEKLQPIAMCYSGHQFGVYVPRLGDGRAILLGEVHHEGAKWDLHLKGAGPTEYSRGGDGRAVLRSTIREYLCNEAMHGLGIPSSRSLCLFSSSDAVYREEVETAAMMIRMAPSHIRFGNFEYFYYTSQFEHLKTLADYVIKWHYSHLASQQQPYLALLQEVTKKTAELVAKWQAYGFTHGVMNTDNMSILGITLDYGPYGFMDEYNSNYNVNHSDHQGRYAFDQQAKIAVFNISCLAQSLLPLFADDPQEAAGLAQACIKQFDEIFWQSYLDIMGQKLGILDLNKNDLELLQELFDKLAKNKVDYGLFFRRLCDCSRHNPKKNNITDLFIEGADGTAWLNQYFARLDQSIDDEARSQQMKQVNPKFILRNYLLQTAIENAKHGELTELDNLLKLAQDPYSEHAGYESYFDLPPDWAREIELSCSS